MDEAIGAELSQKDMDNLLAEARKLIATQPPEAGSVDLDRQLAEIQSGQFEPSDQHRAGLTPTAMGVSPTYPRVLPRRPELTKTDYLGTIAAIGVIGVLGLSAMGMIASLILMMGKSMEGESYRATIEQLVQDNQKLSLLNAETAKQTQPRCYGLIVTSCGEQPISPSIQAEPTQETIAFQPNSDQRTLTCLANAIDTGTPVNVRAGGGTEFNILTQVPCGGVVDVIEDQTSGWSRVKTGTVIGYISTSFLRS